MSTLRVLAPVALAALMDEIAARFTAASGVAVDLAFDLNPAVAARIMAGEAFDAGLTNPGLVASLVAAGRVAPAETQAFARIPLAVGAAAPVDAVASDPATIRALLLGARSVAFTADGTSGKAFRRAAAGLGLGAEFEPRLRPMGAGEPVAAVAAGRADLAIAPLTTVRAAPGVWPVAVFPAGSDTDIAITAFAASTARDPVSARVFLGGLADPGLDALLRAHGAARSHEGATPPSWQTSTP